MMSSPDPVAGGREDAFRFFALRDALPAYVALVVLFAADAAFDEFVVVALVVIGAIVAMFATMAYLEAGARGVRRRRVRECFVDSLDVTERKARRAASMLPMVMAILIAVIASGGMPDGRVFAGAVAICFAFSQLIFALWLNARASGNDRRVRGS